MAGTINPEHRSLHLKRLMEQCRLLPGRGIKFRMIMRSMPMTMLTMASVRLVSMVTLSNPTQSNNKNLPSPIKKPTQSNKKDLPSPIKKTYPVRQPAGYVKHKTPKGVVVRNNHLKKDVIRKM